MSKRLLWLVMVLASSSMLMLVVGWLLWKLGVGLIAGLLYAIAGKVMLLAFGLLTVMLVVNWLRQLWRGLRSYFSAEAMALRRLLSLRIRQLSARQYWSAKVEQLRYRAAFKRRAMLKADNRKQLRSLFRAIDSDLRRTKAQMSRQDYRQLKQSLRRSHRQADAVAMLALREQLPCR